MEVEALQPTDVRESLAAIATAHQTVTQDVPDSRQGGDDPDYWESILEANAAAVLERLPCAALEDGYAVRYRFFERSEAELRVRPFVARTTTDVSAVRAALIWHPPPDGGLASERMRHSRDAELLYQHFSYTPSALGAFQYWLAIQEIWASGAWVHTQVIVDHAHFAEVVSGPDWQVLREVESYEPAVVRGADASAHLATLLYSPLHRHSIAMQRIEIKPDHSVVYAEPITVAAGPRGFVA